MFSEMVDSLEAFYPLVFDSITFLGWQLLPWFSMVVDNTGTATTTPFQWPAVPVGYPFWVAGFTLDKHGSVVSVTEPLKYVTRP